MIEYPKDVFERLEPRVSKEKGLDDYQIPQAKYFSPFENLNDFLGTNNPDFESVYIWNTYDNPSMKIDDNNLVSIDNLII